MIPNTASSDPDRYFNCRPNTWFNRVDMGQHSDFESTSTNPPTPWVVEVSAFPAPDASDRLAQALDLILDAAGRGGEDPGPETASSKHS